MCSTDTQLHVGLYKLDDTETELYYKVNIPHISLPKFPHERRSERRSCYNVTADHGCRAWEIKNVKHVVVLRSEGMNVPSAKMGRTKCNS